jgi:hypothetical protein
MGKTNQPLKILVPWEWLEEPSVKALAEKGHQILACPPVDLVLAPWGHYFKREWLTEKMIEKALKWSRSLKRVKK